ncbi:MAG: Gfo/Idh/MocA family protein, partial [Bacillota bacterium]
AGRATVDATYAAARSSGTYAGCAAYNDYRELLARPDIDAVVIATPDHWHTLQSIDAAKAGKDVYCEKPISMTIGEGRELVRTIQRYGRVFQTGTQYRSIPQIRRVCQFVRDGGLGKIKSVFTLLDPLYWMLMSERLKPYAQAINAAKYSRSYVPDEFPLSPEPVPEGLDWNLWVGPASWHPYNRAYHINPSPGVVPWSFCDSFGVAALTWHLAHSADVIQYALGVETSGPVELIHPNSGIYPTLTCRYANGTLLHFVDHWGMVKDVYKAVPANARLAGNFGGIFVGERGWATSMSVGGPIEGAPDEIFQEMGLKSREVNIGANDHHANWFECIRTRRQPHCPEELGHRTASLGHLAMISHKLQQSLQWDPLKEEFINNDAANRLRSRAMREPWRM